MRNLDYLERIYEKDRDHRRTTNNSSISTTIIPQTVWPRVSVGELRIASAFRRDGLVLVPLILGIALLRELRNRGVGLIRATPFLAEQLKEGASYLEF